MSALAARDVTKRYGGVVALDECSLAIDTEGFHCLLGPNGSGKTTLFRLLLGLERPTAGSVDRDGIAVGSGFQRPNFYPSLTVRENLAVFRRFHDRPVEEGWRDRLVEELRLRSALGRRAGDLSGGFARKLDLALALQHRPDVVLLDEPLGALDDVSRARLLEFLADYAEAGHGVVVSTHRITSFEPHLDRLTVLRDGSVLVDRYRDDLDVEAGTTLQSRYVDMILEGGDDFDRR